MGKIIEGYGGLEYIRINCKEKEISHKNLNKIERKIGQIIVNTRPLRGKEIRFLRKITRLSLGKLIVEMDGMVDQSTIARWEQKGQARLSPANESLMRSFFAYKFDIKLWAIPEILIPQESEELVEIKGA